MTQVFTIRKKVFQEEQGVPADLELDEFDNEAVHALLLDENSNAVATGRIFFTGKYYKIGRIAVLKEERGKKYGDFIVRMLIDKAFLAGAQEVHVAAQIQVIDFYTKIGFLCYGEPFLESDILHQGMKLLNGALCKECNKPCK